MTAQKNMKTDSQLLEVIMFVVKKLTQIIFVLLLWMIGLKKNKRRAVKLGRKIFVSYKYKDNDVKKIPNVTHPTWPCDYVNYIK